MITITIEIKEYPNGVATRIRPNGSEGTKQEKYVATFLDRGLLEALLFVGKQSGYAEMIEGENIEENVIAFLKRKEQEAASE